MACVREMLGSILYRVTVFLRLLFVSLFFFFFKSLGACIVIESQIRKWLLATKSFQSHSISPHYTSTDQKASPLHSASCPAVKVAGARCWPLAFSGTELKTDWSYTSVFPVYLQNIKVKVKVIPQQAEVAQGVPGRLRPQIFLTFSTTRVVGGQPYAPAAFTPGEIPGTHFLEAESTPGHMVLSVGAAEKSPVTPPGIDPGTVRLVAQWSSKRGEETLDLHLISTL